tara:strand:- start:35 stop:880 length:846 start_codon:yes stop_codon:yes gene_type:complete
MIILGTIQDAGSPHIGCKKKCCINLFNNLDKNRKVVSLGIIDPDNNKSFMIEASPDITLQMNELNNLSNQNHPNGIFITHAHIGHYTGLMYLGKEAMNLKNFPIYVMPKLKNYLEKNGPWSQLVSLKNIKLISMEPNFKINITSNISIKPFLIPHRNEYSETCGFKIYGPNKKILFIPDIDKWSLWDKNLINEIKKVDIALIDGTFYNSNELKNRDINKIPHPFIIDTMQLFKDEPISEKSKIYFIHLNHTNPLLNKNSFEYQNLIKNKFKIAYKNDKISL